MKHLVGPLPVTMPWMVDWKYHRRYLDCKRNNIADVRLGKLVCWDCFANFQVDRFDPCDFATISIHDEEELDHRNGRYLDLEEN